MGGGGKIKGPSKTPIFFLEQPLDKSGVLFYNSALVTLYYFKTDVCVFALVVDVIYQSSVATASSFHWDSADKAPVP